MAKGGIQNLKGFQKKLEKRLVKNPEKHLKHLVQRSTTLVEGTAKQSILKAALVLHIKNTIQEGNTLHQHKVSHLQVIQVSW